MKVAVGGVGDDADAAIHQLEDIVAIILSWLGVKDVMRSRRVCKKWKEAVKKTIVPTSNNYYFRVYNVKSYNTMRVMTRALPNLQQIVIDGMLGRGPLIYKFDDGEDPDGTEVARIAEIRVPLPSRDIEIISNFSKLRILEIRCALLNGEYPNLFNFPLLEILRIDWCRYLKWDLEILAGLPLLKELMCTNINDRLSGNTSSLRVLKDTLEKVVITGCRNVEGNFMDLADFPNLKELDFNMLSISGDVRDIGENDFPSLKELHLPNSVVGGHGYRLQRISNAPAIIRAVYRLKKQCPGLKMKYWYGTLSRDSPDWYAPTNRYYLPPFNVYFVQVGSRIGYQWSYYLGSSDSCEVNWLDPEPDRESSDYAKYIEILGMIESRVSYRGFYEPPTRDEYRRLRR